MVQNKYLLPVTKFDVGVYVVDIPKAAGLLNDLFQQELHKCHVSGSLELLAQLLNREKQAAAELGGYAVKTGKVKNIESIQTVMKLVSELSANDR